MFQKIKLISFLGILTFFGWISFPNHAKAAQTCTPTVKIQDTSEKSVKLKVTCASLKSTKVSIKTLVSNDDDTEKNLKATKIKKIPMTG